MKKKMDSGKKIWKFYKKFKFRREILKNLKVLSTRIKIWRKIVLKYERQLKIKKFVLIKEYAKEKLEQEKIAQHKKLL